MQQERLGSTRPSRVIIIGSTGFIGRALSGQLSREGIPLLGVGSKDMDLTARDAGQRLGEILQPTDSVVMLAALTPDKGRDIATFMRNIEMGRAVCQALESSPVSHLVYVSSDAVYAFGETPVAESSLAAPTDLYGVMHLSRELMMGSQASAPYAVIRPTLVYGSGDTHNSYGPNRFVRAAMKQGKITLGGAGEETRDHIWVEDLARLIRLVLAQRSSGTLNVATGKSVSFDQLAHQVAALFTPAAEVQHSERTTPISHRSFDSSKIFRAFPEFQFTSLANGLATAYEAMLLAKAESCS